MINIREILNNKAVTGILLALAAIPVLVYLFYVHKFAVNIPRQDDYDVMLGFMSRYKAATGSEKLSLLISQHNEHRIAGSHLISVLYYSVFGALNFRHLIFINGFMLLLSFGIIAYWIRKAMPQFWALVVLVLSLCMFDLNNAENMNFASSGMQHYGVLLLFAASVLLFASGKKWMLPMALLLQVLCIFSGNNGVLGAVVLVLFNLLQRNKPAIIVSLAGLLAFVPLYCYQYNGGGNSFYTLAPAKVLPYLLHIAGAHFSYTYGVYAALAILAILLVVVPAGKKMTREMMPLLCVLLFVLGTIASIAVFRGGLPLTSSYAGMYYIYAHLLVALAFAFVLYELRSKVFVSILGLAVAGLLSVAYCYSTQDGITLFAEYRNTLKTVDYDYPDKEKARQLSEQACSQGIYCIEQHRLD